MADEGGYQGIGLYEHYKGDKYFVIGLALREESKDLGEWLTEVIYAPMAEGSLLEQRPETFWTRLLTDFNKKVEGSEVNFGAPESVREMVPRFRLLHGFVSVGS
jgi:hypothetical protein